MAMTLMREGGMQGETHAQSGCWSLACSLQLLQGSGTQAKRKIRQGEKALIIDESDGVAVCLEHDACGGSGHLGGWPAECEACGGRPGLWECHPCRKSSLC
ncbi:hypothetical protein Q9233_001766 [Columba guinea]|nr:hypothetical protein Q9233_001766 [Columba guinea]